MKIQYGSYLYKDLHLFQMAYDVVDLLIVVQTENVSTAIKI